MNHYNDVIMGAIASQITNLTIVYSIVYSDADRIKHQRSVSLAFVRGIHRPRTNGQLRGKCFHLMTSSCRGTASDQDDPMCSELCSLHATDVGYPNNFSHFIFNLCTKNKILRVKLCRLYHFHFTWAQRQNLERGIQLISIATAQCFISYSDAVSLTEKNRESLPWPSKWARWSIIQLWKSIVVSLISIIHFNHGYPWLIIIIHAWIVDIHN